MNDHTRLLVIMGSGETTPTMVTPHQRVLAGLGDAPAAVLLDTPYGFQQNADDITARTVEYFDRHVGASVEPLQLRRVEDASPAELEAAVAAVEDADWVFAGPGSPSYLLRQWRATRLPEVLRHRLTAGHGATVFASAAAVTLGRHAVPVYEIYKVGADPHWLDGLDLLSAVGLDSVLIPHFDNAEGGTHDTRYCYLGEQRLARLEAELEDGTFVLGVDEHTALSLDLASGRVDVEGRGGVTVRSQGRATRFEAGATLTIEDLVAAAHGAPPDGAAVAPVRGPSELAVDEPPARGGEAAFLDEVAAHREAFDAALEAHQGLAAADAILALVGTIRAWSADTQQSDEVDRAHDELRAMVVRLGRVADAGLHDHRDLVAPHVEALLGLRDEARRAGEYGAADRIRDGLLAGGIGVHDTPDGTDWELERDDLA